MCGRQPLKKCEGVWFALGRSHPLTFFKDCLSQILLGSLLNTLSQMKQPLFKKILCLVNDENVIIAPRQGKKQFQF